MDLIFEQLNSGNCLTYLVGAAGAGEVALVDPVISHTDAYLTLLASRGLKLTHVIDTHTHADHISGCAKLMDATGCRYVMHELASPKCVTDRVADGAEIKVGPLSIKVLHTPGHTRDSVTLIISDRLIAGDTLFLDDGGAGRDDLPGGNPAEHWESLQKLMDLPDELIVYPGHEYRGRQPSSLGEQKKRNPFFKPSSKEAFVEYLKSLHLGPADWMKDVLIANAGCTRDPAAARIPVDVPACEVRGTATPPPCASQVATINPTELKKRIEAGDGLLLLDVREAAELASELGHLPGVVHIPVGQLEQRVNEIASNKDTTIISICKSGKRATNAAGILAQAGFKHVIVLQGGMLAWQDHDFPVERPQPANT